MSSIITNQTRTVDPYSDYNSNVVNRLTRIFSKGVNSIFHTSPIDVSISHISPLTNLTISTGSCFKDDVFISIDDPYTVDLEDPDYYTGNPFNEVGYYYVCLQYTYIKAKPAPVAHIKIFKPSQHSSLTSGYLFLKAVKVNFNGSIFYIDSVYDYDPSDPSIKRTFTQQYVGLEPFLPAFDTSSDTGRLIYCQDDKQVYYGGDNEWRNISINLYSYDTSLTSLHYLGYITSDSKVHPAIATAFSTFAQCVVVDSDMVQLSGLASISVQTGITINIGDKVYLSSTQAGKITNVEPAFNQLIGVCVDNSTPSVVSVLMNGLGSSGGIDPSLIDQITINENNIRQIASDTFGTDYVLNQETAGSNRTIGIFSNYATSINLSQYATWATAPLGGTIAEFVGCKIGDIRTIIFSNNLTTIKNNSNIITAVGTDVGGIINKTITFIHSGSNIWHEISNYSGTGGNTKIVSTISGASWIYSVHTSTTEDIDILTVHSENLIVSSYDDTYTEIELQEVTVENADILEVQVDYSLSSGNIEVCVAKADNYSTILHDSWILSSPGLYYANVDTGLLDANELIINCFNNGNLSKIIPVDIIILNSSTIQVWMNTNLIDVIVNFKSADQYSLTAGNWILSGSVYYQNIDITSLDATSYGTITTCLNSDTDEIFIPNKVKLVNINTVRVYSSVNSVNLHVNISVNNFIYSYNPSHSTPSSGYHAYVNISSIGSTDVCVSCYNASSSKMMVPNVDDISIDFVSINLMRILSSTNAVSVKVVIIG